MVEPGDAGGLAGGIEYLLLHPDEAAGMGERASATVASRYAVESMVDDYLDVYGMTKD